MSVSYINVVNVLIVNYSGVCFTVSAGFKIQGEGRASRCSRILIAEHIVPKVSLRIELTIRFCSKEILFVLGLFPQNITPFIMILHSGNTLNKLLAKLLDQLII